MSQSQKPPLPADTQLRADAKANRERIMEVAREALTADPLVSLNAIAKAAGVGPGTLYRHFATREALVLAVYRHEIDVQVALAPRLLAAHPPLQAFRLWCDQLVEMGKVKHGIADLLHAARAGQNLEDSYGPMLGAVRQLMAACEAAGAIRPGGDPADFLTLLGLLWQIPPTAEGQARARRLLGLAFRGLGAEAA